jgi:hypothetical protein
MNYTDLMVATLPLSKYHDAAIAGISAVPFCLKSKKVGAGISLVVDWKDMGDMGWDADPFIYKRFEKNIKEVFITTSESVRLEFALKSLNEYINLLVDDDGEISIARVWSRTSDDFGLLRYLYDNVQVQGAQEIFIPWSKRSEYCSQTVIKMAGKNMEKDLYKYTSMMPESAAVYQIKLLQHAVAYLGSEEG